MALVALVQWLWRGRRPEGRWVCPEWAEPLSSSSACGPSAPCSASGGVPLGSVREV